MIHEPIDATKNRLRDAIRRVEQGLPQLDDHVELLERSLRLIDEMEQRPMVHCDCDCGDCE